MNTINKEDMNQYILHFSNWLARLILNLYLTPQGLLSKNEKKRYTHLGWILLTRLGISMYQHDAKQDYRTRYIIR